MGRRPIISQSKTVVYKNGIFKITFPYREETLHVVRSLDGRKFNTKEKFWTCPANKQNYKKLKNHDFNFIDLSTKAKQLKLTETPDLKKELYKFQKIGVTFLEEGMGRGLIADEMGLGKTIQTIGWISLNRNQSPFIIVCPASVKLNWKRELEECLEDPKIHIINGKKIYSLPEAEFYIINYDILYYWRIGIKNLIPRTIVTDECQNYKNNSARRTKAVKYISKSVPHFIALSGTPIMNAPVEIYNAVNLVRPNLFSDYWYFLKRYCDAKHNGFGWSFNGSSNTKELHHILTTSGTMLRRKKSQVFKDLPEKIKTFVPFDISNRSTYEAAEQDFINYITTVYGYDAALSAENAETFVKLEHLKQIAVEGKLNEVIIWIKEFLDSDQKLVVFADHKFVISALMEKFGNIAVKIDGSCSDIQRQGAVDTFQNDPYCRLFIGNIKSAGTAITLTKSANVAFIELPWTPGALNQCIDRIHRIGQKEKHVGIYYLLAINTVEYKLASILDEKIKVSNAVLDGEDTNKNELITSLIDDFYVTPKVKKGKE